MDKGFFLNCAIPTPPQLLDPSSMPTWQSLSSAMEPNSSSDQSLDHFFNSYGDKSADQYTQFDSVLTSMVTSPAASNSAMSNKNSTIREFIGKLGTILNSNEISPPYIGGGNNSTSNWNSSPKLPVPIMMNQFAKNLPNWENSPPLNPALPVVSADPSFVDRAAKFSSFGRHSFNGRSGQFGLSHAELEYRSSNTMLEGEKMQRFFSSHSIKAAGSPMENNDSAHPQVEMMSENGLSLDSGKKLSNLSGSAANSNEESSVSEQISLHEMSSRKRKAGSRGKSKGNEQIASAEQGAEADGDTDTKRPKTEEETKAISNETGEENQNPAKGNSMPPEPPKDYIHVRARRGQATDSHSLAERVRREKISERMKLLQDLVPGCNKVTGKALMLDEIINYVQSLQRQVEFLSMKLASVNPSLDNLLSKDIVQPNNSAHSFYGHQPQQNPNQKNISSGTISQFAMEPLDTTICRKVGLQLPPVEGFGEGLSQFPRFYEDDLQSIVQMGFGQNPNQDTVFHSESFPVQDQTSSMRINL